MSVNEINERKNAAIETLKTTVYQQLSDAAEAYKAALAAGEDATALEQAYLELEQAKMALDDEIFACNNELRALGDENPIPSGMVLNKPAKLKATKKKQ